MRFFNAKTRICFGIVCLVVSIMAVALVMRAGPDPRQVALQNRMPLCEAITIDCAIHLSQGDVNSSRILLTSLVARNEQLISAALRRENGRLDVEAGPHKDNWDSLKPDAAETQVSVPLFLGAKKWGDLEFQREALTARVARAEDDTPGASSHWSAAVQLAGDRRESLTALARFATAWGWDDEFINLLWVVANGRTQQSGALQQLLRKYTAEGKTRDLLRVFSRMLEIDGQNLTTKNNVAYALLLLNLETERANVLAYEVRNSDPTNAQFAATYALSLYAKDKFDGALKVLQQLDEKERRNPTTALSYGVILAAKGMKDEAAEYLDIAEKSNLLPEERTLAEKARAKLAH